MKQEQITKQKILITFFDIRTSVTNKDTFLSRIAVSFLDLQDQSKADVVASSVDKCQS